MCEFIPSPIRAHHRSPTQIFVEELDTSLQELREQMIDNQAIPEEVELSATEIDEIREQVEKENQFEQKRVEALIAEKYEEEDETPHVCATCKQCVKNQEDIEYLALERENSLEY